MKDYEKKYQLLREEKLEDIHSTGYLLQHVKSKAHVLVIANDDENKAVSYTHLDVYKRQSQKRYSGIWRQTPRIRNLVDFCQREKRKN